MRETEIGNEVENWILWFAQQLGRAVPFNIYLPFGARHFFDLLFTRLLVHFRIRDRA